MTKALERLSLFAAFLVIACAFGVGLRWSLPSSERRDLVLPKESQTALFYDQVASARSRLPGRFVEKPMASHLDKEAFHEQLLNSISSFLVRSSDGDEQLIFVALSKIKFRERKWDPGLYAYGGPYYIGMGTVVGAGRLAGALTLSPDIKTYYAHPEKMADVFFAGRLLSAFSGFICALFFFNFIRRLLSWPWAVVSLLLYALCPINLYLTHSVKPHIFATAFALWGFLKCFDLFERPTMKNYLLAGAAFGLAVGTTINLWPLPLFIVITHLFRKGNDGPSLGSRWLSAPLWAGLFCSIFVFFLVNPFIVINAVGWLAEMRYQAVNRRFSFSWEALKWMVGVNIWRGMGAAGFVLSILGGWAWKSKGINRFWKPLSAFTFIYLVISILQLGQSSIGTSHIPRYIAPFFALMAALAGLSLQELFSRWKAGAAVLGVVAVLFSIEQASAALWNYCDDNPRTALNIQAGQWINETIAPGATMGVTSNLMVDRHPPFFFERFNLRLHVAHQPIDSSSAPAYFLLSTNPTLSPESGVPVTVHPHFLDLYELEKSFVRKKAGFYTEYFSSANYGFWLYKRKSVFSAGS